ncbi:MAG: anaerobic carbon-monoxide dehydrogenase catalytic subunit [Spirochaetaceae bacterium]|jgi:carbon-monoxide dehydrogenase catalytic subunit|nr:anaerobic carbon-monoxide dehydrogenase catalytic subunit [Spirochaetaceae bacterium]
MECTKCNENGRTIDPAVQELFKKAADEGIDTAWDRYEQQKPQCGFGELGLCCRNCLQGPCRINPFGEPKTGVCGADADLIVARNLLRSVTGGTASHTDHAYSAVQLLRLMTEGKAEYPLKGAGKIAGVAAKLGIDTKGKKDEEVAREIALTALADFGNYSDAPMKWLTATAPAERVDVWGKLGILPRNPDREIRRAMHATAMGVDGSPMNLLLACLKSGLIDGYAGLHLGTDIQDIIFGIPAPVKTEANMGVLDKNKINIIVHGHMPEVSEKVVEWADKLSAEAKAAGAEGINIAGICCSGNEVLMRHGVPLAGNFLSQELAVITGAVDAMVVDVQCFMPAITKVASCYHTRIITTQGIAQLPDAEHIPIEPEHADEGAQKIIRLAIEAYKKRDAAKVSIPRHKSEAWGGFSVEAIVGALSKVDAANPLKPLVDNIVNGNIKGAVGVVGCNNVKTTQDAFHVELIKELLANDVLVVATGCSAQALAKYGFLCPEGAQKYAGKGLLAVLTAVGEAAGLGGPLPPVLHMGSCVDNSRIGDLVGALAAYLKVPIKDLPVVASAPELQHEKAISIGVWAVALGLMTHIGLPPPVLGSPLVSKVLTADIEGITGGKFYVEGDAHKAAQGILAHIMQKRKGLGL